MPKLVAISTAMVAVPVPAPKNPLDPRMSQGAPTFQIMYQVNALDEEGNAWELVKQGPHDLGRWLPLTRDFALVPSASLLNGANPRGNKEAQS